MLSNIIDILFYIGNFDNFILLWNLTIQVKLP
jgi:hypothetical protein